MYERLNRCFGRRDSIKKIKLKQQKQKTKTSISIQITNDSEKVK